MNVSNKTYYAVIGGLLSVSLCSFASHAKTKYIPNGYKIETINTPQGELFHATGLDVAADGSIFVATRFGDVWQLKNNQWHKFAQGLHEPVGLLCDDDGSIVVGQKPELTRLVDVDGDGKADDYIQVASGWDFHDNYHEYNFAPVKDQQGNYYGTLNLGHNAPNSYQIGAMGSSGGYRGWAYQVNTKGEFVPFAYGLRSPAGIGVSPNNELFYTDNQGDWVETSKLHLLEKDKFYGHPVSLRDKAGFDVAKIEKNKTNYKYFDEMREKPVVWFPHEEVANSPGNPVWDISEGKFGPFKGQMFIGDQTQSNIFRVMLEKVKGKYQGAVINFIDGFQSGNIRVQFDQQGQLWVGQTARGWYSKGGKPFGLQKVTWDGTTPFELLDINLTKKGFKLNFTKPLESDSVNPASFSVNEWNYEYTSRYGSAKHNEKQLPVKSAKLSADKKSIDIELELTANKVVAISFAGLTATSNEKTSVKTVYYTLNQLL